jgi:hypothetical protein
MRRCRDYNGSSNDERDDQGGWSVPGSVQQHGDNSLTNSLFRHTLIRTYLSRISTARPPVRKERGRFGVCVNEPHVVLAQ